MQPVDGLTVWRWGDDVARTLRGREELLELVALLASLLGEGPGWSELEIVVEVVKLGAIVLELHVDVGEQ